MEIDWDYWLNQRLKIADWELLALSFNINPEEIKSYEIDDLNHITDVILDPKFRKKYLKRKDTLQDYRFIAFDYFRNDGIPVDYYDASDSKLKMIYLKRVLLWLKNEEIGWELPKELAAYIEILDKPNEPHWAQELVDNLNNKNPQPITTKSKLAWSLKPLGEIQRMNGYRAVLYQTLLVMHSDEKSTPPTALEVLASWRNEFKNKQPQECNIWVHEKSFDYDNKKGLKKNVDTKSLKEAIQRLIITD